MDTDIHLDTSWCPVCDCLILPRKYTVPVVPPPTAAQLQAQAQAAAAAAVATSSNTAVRSSQTTRGKNGTIKARAGGGLVQGTGGRARPGLNRAQTSKTKAQLLAQQQQLVIEQEASVPVRTRTVIDQAQTPLYCSEACRLRDLEDSWPVAPPSARAVLEAPPTPTLSATTRPSRVKLGTHPSQVNPARASPPPPSPTLPPVPPNSYRAPRGQKAMRECELNLAALNLSIREADEHSDSSSSATGTSFTASDRSPIEEQEDDLFDNSNLYTDPQPPPLPDLPLHPHRPSAPALPPGSKKEIKRPLFEGGIMVAARRLSTLFSVAPVDDERARQERRDKEEQARKEEERKRRWDLTGELKASGSDLRKKKEQKEELQMADHMRWSELVYNYNGASSSTGTGIPSTHRRSSDTGPKTYQVRAPGVPNRTQSALELYEKYPYFLRPNSSAGIVPVKASKSSASLATSHVPVYGVTTSSSSVRSGSSGVSGRTAGASALTLPGADPEVYAGKRIGGGKRNVAKGLEGLLVLPDVLLRPPPPAVSASLPSSGKMKRSGSEASVSRRGGRSASALGAVTEDGEGEMGAGAWHRAEEERSEDSRSSATRSSASAREGRKGKGKKSSRSGSSKSEAKRPVVAEPAWSYENTGPTYDAMPPLPVKQPRFEEVFVPDERAVDPISGELVSEDAGFIQKSTLYARDVEISRKAIREIKRRRGAHEGQEGWWVEKEWEVTVYPERKKLFLFGGASARERSTRVK